MGTLEQLTEVLEYHVIAGVAAKAADLTNGEVLQPLFDGHALTVKLGRGRGSAGVFIEAEGNTVQVTRTDRLCTNGVIHVVDAVLLPNLGPALNIVQTAQGNADLSTLVDVLIASPGGLVATLSGTGPFTVFAPTNEAFAALAAVPAGDRLVCCGLAMSEPLKLDTSLRIRFLSDIWSAEFLPESSHSSALTLQEGFTMIIGSVIYTGHEPRGGYTGAQVD